MPTQASHAAHAAQRALDAAREVSILKDDACEPIRILVSWSPSYAGTEAIEYAAWLARTAPVSIRVVSTFVQPWHSTSLHKLGGKYKKWFKREAEECQDKVKGALTAAGVPKSCWDKHYSILHDGPNKPQMITEAANDFDADLIVLGPHQAAAKGRFMAGSTADTLLHFSPLPIGLTPRKAVLSKRGVTRVNFAFTDSRGSENDPALFAAARLASRWNVPLRILAFSPTGLVHTPIHGHLDVVDQLDREWHEHSLALLDRARDAINDQCPELETTSDIGAGAGWGGAVDALKWKKGDLMVLGSNPLGPFARVFIGSTATELLPHLRVPVLVHPAIVS